MGLLNRPAGTRVRTQTRRTRAKLTPVQRLLQGQE